MPLRVSVTALGCKVNYAEMADLAGRLAAAGCEVVAEEDPADVRVLNTCTVTVAADATSRQRLRRLRRADPDAHIVVTGCSVDGNPQIYLRGDDRGPAVLPAGVDAVFANATKDRIALHVLAMAAGRDSVAANPTVAPLRSRAFIKVQDGCNHRCTYCSVWRARGASRSLPRADIRARVAAAVNSGHGELVLTGVDLGAYGRAHGSSLAQLVRILLDDVGTRARIRLSSVNTNDITAELVDLNAHSQLCSHWHMPLQSGSDTVLRAMHRGYRRDQYLRVCAALRRLDADTEFTTDVMVAFPGETEADHADTLALLEETEMLAAHTFRYSPRDDTPAALRGDRIDEASARRRSADVRRTAAATGHARRARAVGSRQEVVWDRVDGGLAHGVSATYLSVVASATPGARAGGMATVEVEAVDGDVLRARVVDR
ncbi:MAG: MiaB/RimO family radical SAM methylthiotransferase [Candidatus Dormibacteraeota bacterium]|uniref:MiaB/RimO family radical SAM methylthiotransferase n=3 Tax=Candidatus Aeolococcus gillhamiae TaxID=3127015 RepID=A0A934JRL5_9BACT|nr:MiaB/RimO family radical SAM methylthiotransferase [Candidatus Dormibacteraeota bacterium]